MSTRTLALILILLLLIGAVLLLRSVVSESDSNSQATPQSSAAPRARALRVSNVLARRGQDGAAMPDAVGGHTALNRMSDASVVWWRAGLASRSVMG